MCRLRAGRTAAMLLAVLLSSGCGYLDFLPFVGGDQEKPPIDLIAVLPVRELPDSAADGERPVLETHAGRAVTAQVYRYLAEQTRLRFVPDLAVADVAARAPREPLAAARALAKATGADAVIFGTVYRFRERVGTKYAASQPANVSFDLAFYVAESDEVTWQESFDKTQESLSSNLFNWWMFWRAGPYWFTARELAGLGVDRLLDDLMASIP
jgi:hypothetical protein